MHRSKSGNDLLVNLLDCTLDLVTKSVRCCESCAGMRESYGDGEGLVDGFSVGTERQYRVTFRVVETDETMQAT